MDEAFIIHEGHKQIWLVSGIDTITKTVHLDIVTERNSCNLKYFIKNHIESKINISLEGWSDYYFLNDNYSVWTHETHVHRGGDFGNGEHSTSHIEQFWGQIKSIIKKFILYFQKLIGFAYYARETEFRYSISKLDESKIEKKM